MSLPIVIFPSILTPCGNELFVNSPTISYSTLLICVNKLTGVEVNFKKEILYCPKKDTDLPTVNSLLLIIIESFM